jgi:hypothetical protein
MQSLAPVAIIAILADSERFLATRCRFRIFLEPRPNQLKGCIERVGCCFCLNWLNFTVVGRYDQGHGRRTGARGGI